MLSNATWYNNRRGGLLSGVQVTNSLNFKISRKCTFLAEVLASVLVCVL